MSEKKYKRSILNVLVYNIPGAREYVRLLFIVLSVFMVSVVISSFLFVKAVQIGNYAEAVITQKVYLILLLWAFIWLVSFLYSVKVVLDVSYRVAGPIKRMERLLDEILNGKDTTINLREKDALSGIAQRINKLIEMHKTDKMKEHKAAYEQYQQKTDQIQQKTQNL